MLTIKRIEYSPHRWGELLNQYGDRTLYQSPEWLAFLAETQNGEIVVAAVHDGNSVIGYFCGLLVRKFGVRLLGSPLPGWTTSYMGFCLQPGIHRGEALEALRRFAFRELGCVHVEMMDRTLGEQEVVSHGLSFHGYRGFEIDLTVGEDQLFARLDPACRRCIRKAVRNGVVIEQALDIDFATDYYAQLQDVFAKQNLIPTYTIERVRTLIRHLSPTGNLLLLRARDTEGRIIASGIFPGMHSRAYFWGAASFRQFQILRPNELLLWQALKYWKARGIRSFDMGGGGEYKRKYGGREVCVPWVRASRYPLLPKVRNAAAMLMKVRQRLGAYCAFSAQHAS
jgi:hypothetical protein